MGRPVRPDPWNTDPPPGRVEGREVRWSFPRAAPAAQQLSACNS